MTGSIQPSLIDQLRPVLSDERLGTYLTAAGFDLDRALKLYVWNAQVGEAFHLPIQAVEVGLRNRMTAAFATAFGSDWWKDERFLNLLDDDRNADIRQVRLRILNRKLSPVTGQIVAGLSFGFWVGMLHKRYNPPLWGGHLRSAFPSLPKDRNRASLAVAAGQVATLRNRIWHHEPIIKRDLSAEYGAVMTLLEWISPEKAAWVRPYCRVPQLLRQKP
ncbi:MAG: hypothetical protein Q8L23_12290 [Caulobacter sp.]|nr:hypothetical protein [Caulobacter sp.]